MLAHHLFAQENVTNWSVISAFPFITPDSLSAFALQGKVCVTIFTFLSAFGMSRKYQSLESNHALTAKSLTSVSISRYIKMMSGFYFVWLLALLARGLTTPLTQIFGEGSLTSVSFWGQMVIDALGLQYLFGTPTLNATWWYMTLAQVLLFAFPLLYLLYKKIGSLILPLAFLLPLVTNQIDFFAFYAFSAACGIVCAENNFFERVKEKTWPKYIVFIAALILLFSAAKAIAAINAFLTIFVYSALTVVISLLCYCLLSGTRTGKILAFVGTHSANMFLTHTLLFAYLFPRFFYGFHYSELIWLMLMLSSLALSVVLEFVKRKSGYSKLFKRVELYFSRSV